MLSRKYKYGGECNGVVAEDIHFLSVEEHPVNLRDGRVGRVLCLEDNGPEPA